MPTFSVTDAGGTETKNGKAFPATAKIAGVNGRLASSLERSTLTLTYYVGPTASGTGSTTAPKSAGQYTVVASFAGSIDYVADQSVPVTFIIKGVSSAIKLGPSVRAINDAALLSLLG